MTCPVPELFRPWRHSHAFAQWLAAVLCLCAGLALALPARAQEAQTDERSQAVAHTVFGILGYTRWPTELQTVRLCVVGPTEYADELLKGALLQGARQTAVRRMRLDDSHLNTECDSVYAGSLSDDEWRQLVARIGNRPLLSISERQDLCRIGGMFCLDVRPSGVSFEINLDSVARSGVRVNPRVLQLAKRKSGP
ncbi:MAG: YfiR family protein [Acidovorax sp.]